VENFSFLQHYDLYKSTDGFTDKFIMNPVGKKCRFCNKSFPEVTFNTAPHIIPELFGRNALTSNFECDNCNQLFQPHESDTSNMIQHYLGLLAVKTKNGTPIFQSRKGLGESSTYLKSIGHNLNLNFGTNLKDFAFDENNKTLTVNFRTKNFRPFSVYKIFLKMGISLLTNEELEQNNHYLDFLKSELPIKNGMQYWYAHRYMLKSKMHPKPKVNLYKAKTTIFENIAYPEYMIILSFSNIMFQFFLPISINNINEFKKENKLTIELFPSFLLDDLTKLRKAEIFKFDMSEVKKVSITDTIAFHYNRIIGTLD
jgi:hypothetical protein